MLHDKKFTHPELKDNELFFLNMTDEKFEELTVSSKRKGTKLFDGLGNKIIFENRKPVFIAKSEVDNVQNLKELRLAWM